VTLAAGQQLGSYEVVAPLGAGGMGEVYRAKDIRLDREVAIKVLPASLSRDPERVARFQREAKVLASFNHPHIAGIYGFEEVDGEAFLIMELAEGETLAQILRRGPIPVEEAMRFAKQIAEALEAAHDKGIIHRDLKPGNVMVCPEGTVKVLDFGLAKAMVDDSTTAYMANSPTITANFTSPGVILGTAAYMSPEQARGRPIDKRTDIWSFGVVLFEMLTGVGPFRGESVTDSIGAILHKELDLGLLDPNVPPTTRRVIARCLTRDRANRYRDIGDVRLELEAADDSETDAFASRPKKAPWTDRLLTGCIGLALGAALVAMALKAFPGIETVNTDDGPRQYSILLPDDAPLAPAGTMPFAVGRPMFDVSRDGRQLVYAAAVDGGTELHLIDLATGASRPLPATAGGYAPFFAPDGKQIGFFAKEKLFKTFVDLGGTPEVIADAVFPYGAVWASDGTIYFTPNEGGAMLKVPSAGGNATPVTQADLPGALYAWPHLLPDGENLLFTALWHNSAIGIVNTGDLSSQRILTKLGTDGRYAPTGHLLFMRSDRLAAVRFDLARLEVVGDPATLMAGIQNSVERGQFVLSHDGTLVYADGTDSNLARLVWVDRDGQREPLGLGVKAFVAFRLSPDGTKLAVPIRDGTDQDIWVYDLARLQTPTRITHGGLHNNVIWSDDGRYLVYSRLLSDNATSMRLKEPSLGGDDREILREAGDLIALGYDSDRRQILFAQNRENGLFDQMIGELDVAADPNARVEKIETLRGTPYNEIFARYSPDRKWVALNSDETGRWEIYLAAYPSLEQRIQISTGGGEEPLWTADGKRVIYRWGSSWYEVDVSTEPALTASAPKVIVQGPYINVAGYSWDMTRNGEQLLLLEGPDQDRTINELHVITNFFDEIERRCAVNH